jgi:uncharacterized protein YcsI (UPF0317 family)
VERLCSRGSTDLATDLPSYDVWVGGEIQTTVGSVETWSQKTKLRCFLLGCSNSWEGALVEQGLPPKHLRKEKPDGLFAPMYDTNVEMVKVGPFQGNVVVSMRSYDTKNVDAVTRITSEFPAAHGRHGARCVFCDSFFGFGRRVCARGSHDC